MDQVGRKSLPHALPSWLGNSSQQIFFITICAQNRSAAPLVQGDLPARLLDSIRFYQEARKWWIELALIMPDHLHLLAYFPNDMAPVVRTWKHWIAHHLGIEWQRDFFDHRLRSDEKWGDTAEYILQNPVRAGLVADWKEWPHLYIGRDGTPCRP